MTVREELEWQEHKRLNPLAAFADQSRGRLRFEEHSILSLAEYIVSTILFILPIISLLCIPSTTSTFSGHKS